MIKFGSVCSGIEAASVAWHPLGWEAAWLSEIEKFPSQVLAHHYPNTPNFGDMTKFKEWSIDSAINVLVGGTPCQSFSVAGLRKGLDDPRGNLMLTYLAIAAKYQPKWLVWENVPGVLSSNGGLDFASLLRGMGELGYGFAYRVLDAQYFGVAQRRRRVFVVGYIGNWRPAAAVLFERHSLSGHPAPSREKRESTSATITARTGVSRNNYEECLSTYSTPAIGSIREDVLSSCITKNTGGGGETQNPAFVLQTMAVAQPIGLDEEQNAMVDAFGTLKARTAGGGFEGSVMQANMQVRRLTPMECERLQGFPDGYTDIQLKGKATPDGPRYKALGNSMAVPVMAWIGKRIQQVEDILG
jgi:DNA (cytosine-5)-methyltransferase 1